VRPQRARAKNAAQNHGAGEGLHGAYGAKGCDRRGTEVSVAQTARRAHCARRANAIASGTPGPVRERADRGSAKRPARPPRLAVADRCATKPAERAGGGQEGRGRESDQAAPGEARSSHGTQDVTLGATAEE